MSDYTVHLCMLICKLLYYITPNNALYHDIQHMLFPTKFNMIYDAMI